MTEHVDIQAETKEQVKNVVRKARPAVVWLARFGFVAKGFVYFMIGLIAILASVAYGCATFLDLTLGTFSETVVCASEMVVPIRHDMPWPQAALVGCCVPTGVGAVTRHAKIEAGSSVLVIGCGAGVTAGAVSIDPMVKDQTIAEIEPLVPRVVSTHFAEHNFNVVANPKVTVHLDDARHYLLTTNEKFDAITSDPLDPWVKGAATLYTREFFNVVKDHLNPNGVVTLFVQLYESNEAAVKSEIATFLEVFPNGTVWANNIGRWSCNPGATYSHNVGTKCSPTDKAVSPPSSCGVLLVRRLRSSSSHIPARVHDDVVPGDIPGPFRDEEAHRGGNVALLDEPSQGGLVGEVLVDLLGCDSPHPGLLLHDGVHAPAMGDVRAHVVHGDAVGREVGRAGLGEGEHAALGRGVGRAQLRVGHAAANLDTVNDFRLARLRFQCRPFRTIPDHDETPLQIRRQSPQRLDQMRDALALHETADEQNLKTGGPPPPAPRSRRRVSLGKGEGVWDHLHRRLGRFSREYWGLFLLYALLAPVLLFASTQGFGNIDMQAFAAVLLLQLGTAILVGLPTYLIALDRLGELVALLGLQQVQVSLKSRIMLLGGFVPLLSYSMLMHYQLLQGGGVLEVDLAMLHLEDPDVLGVRVAVEVVLVDAGLHAAAVSLALRDVEGVAEDHARLRRGRRDGDILVVAQLGEPFQPGDGLGPLLLRHPPVMLLEELLPLEALELAFLGGRRAERAARAQQLGARGRRRRKHAQRLPAADRPFHDGTVAGCA